jgi:hypothetical protein
VHPGDVAAWTHALGVGARELPWAIASRVRTIEDLHAEITRPRTGLAEVPDEEMLASISSASRALSVAGDRLNEALVEVRREA